MPLLPSQLSSARGPTTVFLPCPQPSAATREVTSHIHSKPVFAPRCRFMFAIDFLAQLRTPVTTARHRCGSPQAHQKTAAPEGTYNTWSNTYVQRMDACTHPARVKKEGGDGAGTIGVRYGAGFLSSRYPQHARAHAPVSTGGSWTGYSYPYAIPIKSARLGVVEMLRCIHSPGIQSPRGALFFDLGDTSLAAGVITNLGKQGELPKRMPIVRGKEDENRACDDWRGLFVELPEFVFTALVSNSPATWIQGKLYLRIPQTTLCFRI